MELDRGDRDRDEVWARARDAPSAGDKWEAGNSEHVEGVSAPISGTGLPIRSGLRVPI